ncbi:MAG TPA: hypothetical protein PLZ57_03670 [Pseudobdellovibrionaceae bacterium]|nr:hypothetical protein [Pseudobdellovibrionaceae bacterium]
MKQEGTRPESNTLPEMQELSEQIGEFIHYWGFKRIHGKIWTHLFLAERPLDAADLVRQMKISKALVSISLRELMEFEVIEEVGKSARGTHLYRPNPDILKVILAVLRGREKRMLTRIQAAAEALERTAPQDRQNTELSDKALGQLGALVTKAQMGLESFISLRSVDFGEWRQAFITTDLKEEAELRAKSVVAPSSRRKDEDDDGLSPVSGGTSSMSSGVSAAAVSPTASDTPPVLSSGQGIGFRIYE